MPEKCLQGEFRVAGRHLTLTTSPVPDDPDEPAAYALGLKLQTLGLENVRAVPPSEVNLDA